MNIQEYANEIRIESGKAMSKLWFGTIFSQSILTTGWDMINLPCFFFLQIFRKKKALVYIHDDANELISIFEYGMKGQCLSFNFGIRFVTLYWTQGVIWLIYYVYPH